MNSIRHLELVLAIATHRHFGRAAKALEISQPALTKGLHHIEKVLGVRLFDRDGSVAPTVFGEIVLARGDAILAAFAELLREVQLARGLDTGQLTVSVGLYPAEISAQEALGALSYSHPSIVCSLNVKNWVAVVDDVLEGRCDLGFADITEIGKHPELEIEPVRKCAFRIVCREGHPLTSRASITIEDIFEFPWVGVNIPNSMLAFLPSDSKPFGVIDKATGRAWPRLRVETFAAIKSAVLSGNALAGVPDVLLDRDLAEGGRLAVLPVELPWLGLNYGFFWRRGRSVSPAAKSYMDIVRRIEAKLGERF